MNTYSKYCPNVFLAKCTEQHERGETIIVETKYGKENESIVFNLIFKKDDYYYYSIVRADGFNVQEHAKNKANKLMGYAGTATQKSNEYYEASNEGKDFLSLGEPIKVGHHSEKRHRALIDRNWSRMSKSVEYSRKSEEYTQRAEYWKNRTEIINLSMPESIDYFAHKLEGAKMYHTGIKNGFIQKEHSYSLTYAKKDVNKFEKNFKLALKLWAE